MHRRRIPAARPDRDGMPPSSSSVAGAKGRSKTALGPGYSLMAWMRLSQGADLSGGVGAVDPDEDEAKWKEWDGPRHAANLALAEPTVLLGNCTIHQDRERVECRQRECVKFTTY